MNRFFQWPGIITSVIILGCALCLVALGIETGWGRAWRKDVVVQPMKPAKAADAAMLPSFALAPLEAGFPESANRPLFMPSRRPVPAAAAAPTMKRGQFILVGTSRTKEFGDSAMLKEVSSNKTSIVKVGSTINNMTLESVSPDKVVLKLGDETEELVMKARTQARPAGAPPPSALPGAAAQPAQAAAMQSPGSGIFGGPAPVASSVPAQAQGLVPRPVTAAPGAGPQPLPGMPGSPTVFPGAPGSNITPSGQPGAAPGGQARPPTPEEILERRRRARAAQQQAQ